MGSLLSFFDSSLVETNLFYSLLIYSSSLLFVFWVAFFLGLISFRYWEGLGGKESGKAFWVLYNSKVGAEAWTPGLFLCLLCGVSLAAGRGGYDGAVFKN